MISYEHARELVLAEAHTCGVERVPTDRACGLILAEDVRAKISSPPFNKAAMDGYAVRAEDVADLPAVLEVVGEVFAGAFPEFTVGPGQASLITTGAPVPGGADTVIMVEHTEQAPEGRVKVLRTSGTNICPKGEDIEAGESVLRAGQRLTPLRVGIAASAGRREVRVRRLPATALLCTGTEVVEPGGRLGPGRIFNANGPMLSSLLRPLSREFSYLGIVGDDEKGFLELVARGLQSDLFVITGGVSMGQYDFVPEALKRAGVRQVFHKLAVKPGKPTFFGVAGGTLVFAMPGNPQSCFVQFKMLVEGALEAMSGSADPAPHFETGTMEEGFDNKPARLNALPCDVRRRAGATSLKLHPYHGSADIVGPAAADGFLLAPRGAERVNKGDELRFFAI